MGVIKLKEPAAAVKSVDEKQNISSLGDSVFSTVALPVLMFSNNITFISEPLSRLNSTASRTQRCGVSSIYFDLIIYVWFINKS